jgi:hypothetical protein
MGFALTRRISRTRNTTLLVLFAKPTLEYVGGSCRACARALSSRNCTYSYSILLDKIRAPTEEFPNQHKLDIGKALGNALDELDEPIPGVVALRRSVALGRAPVGHDQVQLAVILVAQEVYGGDSFFED